MAYNIGVHDFIARFQGGGARPNLYMVRFNFPAGVEEGDNSKKSYLCKAASLPESTIGTVNVPFMGRSIKVAGDKEFADWTVTMLADTDMDGRKSFEKWVNLMNNHQDNTGRSNPSDYYQNLSVDLLDRNGEVIYTTDLKSCFPTNVGEVSLGYDNNDAIAEYTVTFAVNYWTSDGTGDGTGGGTLV